jgi:hypothetical protein
LTASIPTYVHAQAYELEPAHVGYALNLAHALELKQDLSAVVKVACRAFAHASGSSDGLPSKPSKKAGGLALGGGVDLQVGGTHTHRAVRLPSTCTYPVVPTTGQLWLVTYSRFAVLCTHTQAIASLLGGVPPLPAGAASLGWYQGDPWTGAVTLPTLPQEAEKVTGLEQQPMCACLPASLEALGRKDALVAGSHARVPLTGVEVSAALPVGGVHV